MKKLMLKRKEKKKEKIEGKVSVSNVEKVEELQKENLFLQYNKVKEQENNIIEVEMVTEKEVDNKGKVQEQEEETGKLSDRQDKTMQIQEKRINKMKVIKYGREFKYEEISEVKTAGEKEKEKGFKEEQRFKRIHTLR